MIKKEVTLTKKVQEKKSFVYATQLNFSWIINTFYKKKQWNISITGTWLYDTIVIKASMVKFWISLSTFWTKSLKCVWPGNFYREVSLNIPINHHFVLIQELCIIVLISTAWNFTIFTISFLEACFTNYFSFLFPLSLCDRWINLPVMDHVIKIWCHFKYSWPLKCFWSLMAPEFACCWMCRKDWKNTSSQHILQCMLQCSTLHTNLWRTFSSSQNSPTFIFICIKLTLSWPFCFWLVNYNAVQCSHAVIASLKQITITVAVQLC